MPRWRRSAQKVKAQHPATERPAEQLDEARCTSFFLPDRIVPLPEIQNGLPTTGGSFQIVSCRPAQEPAHDFAIECRPSKFVIDADRLSHRCSGWTIRLFLTEP